MALQQYRAANQAKIKSTLDVPAKNFQSQSTSISHQELNNRVWLEFIGCVQQQQFNYEQQVNVFVNSFIDEQYKVVARCLMSLEKVINNYTTGWS